MRVSIGLGPVRVSQRIGSRKRRRRSRSRTRTVVRYTSRPVAAQRPAQPPLRVRMVDEPHAPMKVACIWATIAIFSVIATPASLALTLPWGAYLLWSYRAAVQTRRERAGTALAAEWAELAARADAAFAAEQAEALAEYAQQCDAPTEQFAVPLPGRHTR